MHEIIWCAAVSAMASIIVIVVYEIKEQAMKQFINKLTMLSVIGEPAIRPDFAG